MSSIGLAINGAFGSDEPSTVESSMFRDASSSLSLPVPPDGAVADAIAPAGLAPRPQVEPDPIGSRVGASPHPDARVAIDSGADAKVEPDPDFEDALRRARIRPGAWLTDFSRHTVPYDEIISGGPPRDGIPPLDAPTFVTPEEAKRWLRDQEPVIALEINGDARAYPLQIMTWHEIVNDVVGGDPVTITFCPLCNAAIVFDRRLDGVVHDFGTSGKLRNSDPDHVGPPDGVLVAAVHR